MTFDIKGQVILAHNESRIDCIERARTEDEDNVLEETFTMRQSARHAIFEAPEQGGTTGALRCRTFKI